MMTKTAQYEAGGLVLAGLVIVGSLLPAVHLAKQEARDGIRRTEVINHKRQLEQIFNRQEFYPVNYEAAPHRFIVEEKAGEAVEAWYIRAELENNHRPEQGFDTEYNVFYRYIQEGGKSWFDVCGGTSTCVVEK